MKNAEAKIKLVTPCISSGADQRVGEIRAQSLRGELHYWFRALRGTLDEERRIFGRIGDQKEIRRSSLNVRTVIPDALRTSVKDCKAMTGSDFDYFLWPMREQSHTPGSGGRGIVEAGETFELRLNHVRIEGGKNLSEDVLKVFLMLGGLGTRSRRCYGSLWADDVKIDGEEWEIPSSKSEFVKELFPVLGESNISVSSWGRTSTWSDAVKLAQEILQSYRCGSPKSGTPSDWGKNDHDVPLNGRGDVYRQILGLPLQQRYSKDKGTWRSGITGNDRKWNDRWASPLRLKIVPLEGHYYVLAIFMGDELMDAGTEVDIKGKGRPFKSKVSDDLWYALKEEGTPIIDW